MWHSNLATGTKYGIQNWLPEQNMAFKTGYLEQNTTLSPGYSKQYLTWLTTVLAHNFSQFQMDFEDSIMDGSDSNQSEGSDMEGSVSGSPTDVFSLLFNPYQ